MADVRDLEGLDGKGAKAVSDPMKTGYGRSSALQALKLATDARDAAMKAADPDTPLCVQKWVKAGKPACRKTQDGSFYYRDRLGACVDLPCHLVNRISV